MVINLISYVYFFFYKFLFYLDITFVIISVCLVVVANLTGNLSPIKDKNITNWIKNILIVNILSNIFLVSLLLYCILFMYKVHHLELLLSTNKIYINQAEYNLYFYTFDFDIFNIIFFILSLFVAFISLLSLDTRIYSSKSVFLVLCNVLVVIIFMFSFTNNYALFFIFYELLLIPSFFFVYRISPAKTSIQSSIYFVM